MSYVAQDIIKKLLDPNPTTRLGAGGVEEIKNHPFFEGLDWENLYLEPRHATFVPRIQDEADTGYFIAKEQGDSFVEGAVYKEEKKFVVCFSRFLLTPAIAHEIACLLALAGSICRAWKTLQEEMNTKS